MYVTRGGLIVESTGLVISDAPGEMNEPDNKNDDNAMIEESVPNSTDKAKIAESDILDSSFVLEKGMAHPNVKELKRKLNRLGFGKLKTTEKFGTFAEMKIKKFQRYYDLETNGKADTPTIEKINEILDSPFQLNNHHESITQLKQKLNWIGYGDLKVTSKFGPTTENRVKKFQKAYKLPISGIADPKTRTKIDEVFSKIYSLGGKYGKIEELKLDFIRIGFRGIEITRKYGPFMEQKVREFQEFYGLDVTGRTDVVTLNKVNEILNSPLQLEKRHEDVILLKKKLSVLGYGGVRETSKFGKTTEKKVMKFQKDYYLPVSGIADKKTLDTMDQAIKCRELAVYNQYDLPLDEAVEIQLKEKVHPLHEKEEVEKYLNPANLVHDEKQKFLFLNLAKPNVATEADLNKYLENKGIFKEKAEEFVKAGNAMRINEVFLVIKALMETNDGSSDLAMGTPVDKNGKVTYMNTIKNGEKHKIPSITNQTEKVVFNVYGIHDGEDSSLDNRAKKAFIENWDTPEKALMGGAEFIKDRYIGHDHDTFYKMLWHPGHMAEKRDVKKLYDIDMEWVLKQINRLHRLYKQLGSYDLYLDIPVYKNEEKIDIKMAN